MGCIPVKLKSFEVTIVNVHYIKSITIIGVKPPAEITFVLLIVCVVAPAATATRELVLTSKVVFPVDGLMLTTSNGIDILPFTVFLSP